MFRSFVSITKGRGDVKDNFYFFSIFFFSPPADRKYSLIICKTGKYLYNIRIHFHITDVSGGQNMKIIVVGGGKVGYAIEPFLKILLLKFL